MIGLAFGIGMLVDNSIVVLENIYRHYHLTGDRYLAALRGTKEVAKPIFASTLTTVIVFVPMGAEPGTSVCRSSGVPVKTSRDGSPSRFMIPQKNSI